MPQVNNQSDASKLIKRVNERIAQLSRLQKTDNPYITAYSRAIHELGLEFTKDTGSNRYRIKNTTENRRKAEELDRKLKQYHARTVADIKQKTKTELRKEAETLAAKKPPKERKKFIREYTSKSAVQERVSSDLENQSMQDRLDFLYTVMGDDGKQLGNELRRAVKTGDSAGIYDAFGKIRREYRDQMRGDFIQSDIQRADDLNNLYRQFGDD